MILIDESVGVSLMGEVVLVAAAGAGTALATGLGAVPVFALGTRADALRPSLWGLAAGVMSVASVVGLLAPALDEGSGTAVGGGLAAGVLFLVGGRRMLARRDVHVGALSGAGVRRSVIVFGEQGRVSRHLPDAKERG